MSGVSGKLYENAFNEGLALSLGKAAPSATGRLRFLAERSGLLGGNKRADVLMLSSNGSPGWLPVACECEYNSGNPDKDAKRRLGDTVVGASQKIKITVAVKAPAGAENWNDQQQVESELGCGARLEYAVHFAGSARPVGLSASRWPERGWIDGDAAALAELLVFLSGGCRGPR